MAGSPVHSHHVSLPLPPCPFVQIDGASRTETPALNEVQQSPGVWMDESYRLGTGVSAPKQEFSACSYFSPGE